MKKLKPKIKTRELAVKTISKTLRDIDGIVWPEAIIDALSEAGLKITRDPKAGLCNRCGKSDLAGHLWRGMCEDCA